jgi:hypothetical protein
MKLIVMMEGVRTSETSVDNYFARQYIPQDNSELHRPNLIIILLDTRVYAFRLSFS